MPPVLLAAVLALAAPNERSEHVHFIAWPFPVETLQHLQPEPLRDSWRAVAASFPALAPIDVDDPHGPLAEAQRALARADWTAAVDNLRRHADTGARGAARARYNAELIEVGLGTRRPDQLLDALLDVPAGERPEAAPLYWDARRLLSDDRARKWHAEMYLRGFADLGGRPLRILAEIELARLEWQQSCPLAGVDGTCGVMARVDWPRGPCERAERDALLLFDRDPALADAAQRRLKSAMKRARKLARADKGGPRGPELRDALSLARWLLAEPTFEDLRRDLPPRDARHGVDAWLAEIPARHARLEHARQRDQKNIYERRSHHYFDRQFTRFNDLQRAYTDIALEASPTTLFAALLRSSQTSQALALARALDLDQPAIDRSDIFFCCGSPSGDMDEDAMTRRDRFAALARAVGHLDRWSESIMTDAATRDPDLQLAELSPAITEPQPAAFGLATLDR